MISLDDIDIKDFICNETSSFALNIIDIETLEVIYINKAMNDFMFDPNATKCFKSIYGNESKCSWCGLDKKQLEVFSFEHFNEKTNKWYQVESKKTKLKNGREILVSIALDISIQKEVQGNFISTQVRLVQQTQALKKAKKELKLLASIDPMTKLFNRRYFTEISESVLELAKRNNTDTAIIMLDIDKFKNVNDTYGHKAGDDIIIALSKKLQEINRKSDITSRWGGEEFLMLLPNTNLAGALVISEKIRKTIENLVINTENNQEITFTVSIGVTECQNDINIEAAINRADQALYKAKKNGRNRVCSKEF